MLKRKLIGIIPLMICLALSAGNAFSEGAIQKYLNDAAKQAATQHEPAQKRAVLDDQYRRLQEGMTVLSTVPAIPQSDRLALKHDAARLGDLRDELSGRNGFVRVGDRDIDRFAQFAVEQMEQADTVIVISGVTLLLLLILIVLIVR